MSDQQLQAIPQGARIILVRHGRPDLPLRPRTSHHEFRDYIDAYEAAGLDPQSLPPRELSDLVRELDHVFTSDRPRARESAQALAPHAELVADPLFAEAPLASPRIPLLKMRVPKWAVVARIMWHAGYHPEIEDYRKAKHRAAMAAEILIDKIRDGGEEAERPRERERPENERPRERERPETERPRERERPETERPRERERPETERPREWERSDKQTSAVALVAHGYFNAMIGRQLRKRGFTRIGAHRARYWNAVIYRWEGS